MKEIDTSAWGEFRVGDLLRVVPGRGCTKQEITNHPGSLQVVQSTSVNNSVTGLIDRGYCEAKGYVLTEGPSLTVVGTGQGAVGMVFFHQETVVVGNNAKLLKPHKDELAPLAMLFIAAVLNSRRSVFSYSDIVNVDRYEAIRIRLPVTPAGDPDWEYMEQTMREVFAQKEHDLDELIEVAASSESVVDTSDWGEFRVDDLFTLVKGSRLTSLARREGEIPYVGASQFNNGITDYIGNDEKLHPAGVLTVCYNGPVGTTFYQPQEFWATDDVNVLYPKAPISMESLLFIGPMLENAGSEYAYVDKWKMSDMASAVIRLPVTPTGDPDWDYMEQTMRDVMAESEISLDILQSLAGEPT